MLLSGFGGVDGFGLALTCPSSVGFSDFRGQLGDHVFHDDIFLTLLAGCL